MRYEPLGRVIDLRGVCGNQGSPERYDEARERHARRQPAVVHQNGSQNQRHRDRRNGVSLLLGGLFVAESTGVAEIATTDLTPQVARGAVWFCQDFLRERLPAKLERS